MPTSNQPSAPIDLAVIDRIVSTIGGDPECVIPILQALQNEYHYLAPQALQRVATTTRISAATLTAVASFYPQFRQHPAGKHQIKVCIGTACYTKGAPAVFQACKRYLGIAADADTDDRKLFTVEQVACLGCCMLAPAVQIDDSIYGFIKPHTVAAMISDFLQKRQMNWQEPQSTAASENGLAQIRICLCSSCAASGAKAVYRELARLLTKMALPAVVKSVACTGMAYRSPLIEIVLPNGQHWHYGNVVPEEVRAIVLEHLRPQGMRRRIVARVYSFLEKLVSDDATNAADHYRLDWRYGVDLDYLNKQRAIATEGYGQLAPLSLDDYRRHGGWEALQRCLHQDAPETIIARIGESGLRGRGGGGYPTAQKWEAVHSVAATEKYVICNGDEGDPGAFMDRLLMESFPLRVLEGIIIASYAVGATQGFVYIRAEYPLAAARMRQAIALCQANNLLGTKILGSKHSFALRVVEGAGAFVCGEETALLAAIEGKRGTPALSTSLSGATGVMAATDFGEQCRNLCHGCVAIAPWPRSVRPDRQRCQQGNQDFRPGRESSAEWSGRSGDGDDVARDCRGYRRWGFAGPAPESGSGRWPVGRLRAGSPGRYSGRLRTIVGCRCDYGVRGPGGAG